jgi:ParB family transcriptional regulator, chromosome partitioning protein
MSKQLKKADFGKGIRALLSQPAAMDSAIEENKADVVRELSANVAEIPLEAIEVNPFQPRKDFDQQALEELANSIRIHGLIQPITVRRLNEKQYQLISGERRWRASQMAGLIFVPAYMRIADDQQMLEMALIENIQREELNSVEVAISYQRLLEECNLTHEMLSERVGKGRSSVTNHLRLLKLPPEIQRSMKEKKLSMGHAKALVGVTDIAFQLTLFKEILTHDLSVRAVELMIKGYNDPEPIRPQKGEKPRLTEDLRQIQDKFSAYFGSKVVLKRDEKGKGQVVVNFSNDNELNRMLDLIED